MRFDSSAATKTYLDPATAARELGISEIALKRLRLNGEISHYRPTPRKVLFTREDLEVFRTRKVMRVAA